MIATLENAKTLLADEKNPLILLMPLYSGQPVRYINLLLFKVAKPERKYFIVQKEITVRLSNGLIIIIPKGFKTDLSSVPRLLWGIASPHGDFDLAAIIHDYLYIYKGCNRDFADFEMYTWSEAINPNPDDNRIRYRAVQRFGQSWWDGNANFVKQTA